MERSYSWGLAFVLLLTAFGFFFMEWWVVMVNMVLVGGVSVLYRDGGEGEKLLGSRGKWLWWCGFVLLVAMRIYPFFLSSAPLGYDTGIYLQAFEVSRDALPDYVSQLFLGIPLLTNVLFLFGFSSFHLISGFYVFFSVFLGLMIHVLATSIWGERKALGVFLLFVVSLTQWQAFSFMLYKNIIGLSLLILAFLLVYRRSLLVLPVVFFLALLQPPDFFLWSLSMVVYFLWSVWKIEERRFLVSLFLFGVFGGVVLLFFDGRVWESGFLLLKDYLSGAEGLQPSMRNGIFIPLEQYLSTSLWYLGFAGIAVANSWRASGVRVLLCFTAVALCWVLSRALFYERFLIELDLMLIVFAGSLAVPLFDALWKSISGKLTVFVFSLSLLANLFFGVFLYKPWMSDTELVQIRGLCSSVPTGAYVMVIDSVYGPWVSAFSCHDTIIPGMGDFNRWNYDEWKLFWAHQDLKRIRELMQRYADREVYVYVGERQVQLVLDPLLFQEVGNRIWKWVP